MLLSCSLLAPETQPSCCEEAPAACREEAHGEELRPWAPALAELPADSQHQLASQMHPQPPAESAGIA